MNADTWQLWIHTMSKKKFIFFLLKTWLLVFYDFFPFIFFSTSNNHRTIFFISLFSLFLSPIFPLRCSGITSLSCWQYASSIISIDVSLIPISLSLSLSLPSIHTSKVVKNAFLTRHEKYKINSDCKNGS